MREQRHYASSGTTQPTHASLLTGLHPWQHGLTRNGQALGAELRTVAEVFSAGGYRTGAVIASFPLHESFGFGQGFEVFDDDFESKVGRSGRVYRCRMEASTPAEN